MLPSLPDRLLGWVSPGSPRKPVPAITFPVADVPPARRRLWQEPAIQAVRRLLGRRVEACSRYHGRLLRFGSWWETNPRLNSLIAAATVAYRRHYPLALSPDVVWLTIAQGLGQHIRLNAEEFRERFVRHEGQKELVVSTEFLKGSPENAWPEAFAEFSEGIRQHIGSDLHGLFVAEFSTTTPAAKAAMEVVLFDAVQPFFRYVTMCICGIPAITVEGTAEDWRSMVERVRRFDEFGLDWWTRKLVPVLETIAETAEGKIDREFWKRMYVWNPADGCISEWVTGWLQVLFPYLKSGQKSGRELRRHFYFDRTWTDEKSAVFGPDPQDFPTGYSEVPCVLKCLRKNRTYPMQFIGGLLGVAQDSGTLTLHPEVGWAVCDDTAPRWGTTFHGLREWLASRFFRD